MSLTPRTYHILTPDGISTYRTTHIDHIIRTHQRYNHNEWALIRDSGVLLVRRREVQ